MGKSFIDIHFLALVLLTAYFASADNNGKGRSTLYLVRVPVDDKEAFDRQMRKFGYSILHDTGELEFKFWALKR